jgi:hypothetical protein
MSKALWGFRSQTMKDTFYAEGDSMEEARGMIIHPWPLIPMTSLPINIRKKMYVAGDQSVTFRDDKDICETSGHRMVWKKIDETTTIRICGRCGERPKEKK